MKLPLLLVASCVFLSHVASGQTAKNLDGFLDIPWGMSREAAKSALAAKTGAKYDRLQDNRFIFHGGTFAGRPVNAFVLNFVGDRLFRGEVFVAAGAGRTILEALKKDLIAKYGPPTVTGNVTKWVFPVTPFHKEAESVTLSEDKKNQIRVAYTNDTMATASGEKADL